MAKKLYLNTTSEINPHISNLSIFAIINNNDIVVQPPRLVKQNYLFIDLSETGAASISHNFYEYDYVSTHSFAFCTGGKPQLVGIKQTNSYYESKPTININFNKIK